MITINKSGMTIKERIELENLRAKEAKNAANLEYLSMMTGIDLYEDEVIDEEVNNDATF